ncbi:MAG: hypothetical protein RIG63_21830 [Coleofasciculus chthonoplastes F3-SA18-01]
MLLYCPFSVPPLFPEKGGFSQVISLCQNVIGQTRPYSPVSKRFWHQVWNISPPSPPSPRRAMARLYLLG